MLLKDLLETIYTKSIPEQYQFLQISSVDCDSRKVRPGSLFVALKGTKLDGIEYVQQALEQGAVCVVVGHSQGGNLSEGTACFLEVSDPKNFLKLLALRFYQDPSQSVQCLGITGTNGKTTTTYLIESIQIGRASCRERV